MEAKPVTQKQEPAYPTRRDVLKSAAAFVLVGLAGTRIAADEGKGKGITVAPVFEHGNGRGAAGCIVVSPPVFLSEEEAMQILREEMTKHGIKLEDGGVLESVHLPRSLLSAEEAHRDLLKSLQNELDSLKEGSEKSSKDLPRSISSFKVDGLDRNKHIAVEFVSVKDYPAQTGGWSSVRDYNFRDVAQKIASTVKEQGKDDVFFAVFYDPVSRQPPPESPKDGEKIDWQTVWRERRERGMRESKKLLRHQAQDFVAWLKKQKAIP